MPTSQLWGLGEFRVTLGLGGALGFREFWGLGELGSLGL